jgi:PhzF family phenazine biosynthesis protein
MIEASAALRRRQSLPREVVRMSAASEVLRYAAFTETPAGGNPAGVMLDAAGLDAPTMQTIANDVGYSETAFVTGDDGEGNLRVRYFSPDNEVPFCGHATIATAVAWAQHRGVGRLRVTTAAGLVEVEVHSGDAGSGPVATLTSVAPHTTRIDEDDLAAVLSTLHWAAGDLDPGFPPRVAYAGAHHLVLAAATPQRLTDLHYEFDRLRILMNQRRWTTLQLVHRAGPLVFRARNPFPPGGVVEDPATGAAAAAFGGYLRKLGLIDPPAQITIHQGSEIGRPSVLIVDIPIGTNTGIRVSGTAVVIPR